MPSEYLDESSKTNIKVKDESIQTAKIRAFFKKGHLCTKRTHMLSTKNAKAGTSFNRIGLCVSFKQVSEDRINLTKYTIVANE